MKLRTRFKNAFHGFVIYWVLVYLAWWLSTLFHDKSAPHFIILIIIALGSVATWVTGFYHNDNYN